MPHFLSIQRRPTKTDRYRPIRRCQSSPALQIHHVSANFGGSDIHVLKSKCPSIIILSSISSHFQSDARRISELLIDTLTRQWKSHLNFDAKPIATTRELKRARSLHVDDPKRRPSFRRSLTTRTASFKKLVLMEYSQALLGKHSELKSLRRQFFILKL